MSQSSHTARPHSPVVLMFHLSDGTRIEIRQPSPLSLEEAHRESCRWAERLEVILPGGQLFGAAAVAGGQASP